MRDSKGIKKNIQKFHSRPGRDIVVDGIHWKWKVGSTNVVAYSSDGDKKLKKLWDIKGISPDEFEKGQYKKNSDGVITPSEIAKWLGL